MNGAREYAYLFSSGQYGKLRLEVGSHARGSTFSIYVGEGDKEVEVYGMTGGHRGWTESYGWLHKGPWQEDFRKLVELQNAKRELRIKAKEQTDRISLQIKNKETMNILANYKKVVYGQDGNQVCAHYEDFINLQESPCGFGDTEEDALKELLSTSNHHQ